MQKSERGGDRPKPNHGNIVTLQTVRTQKGSTVLRFGIISAYPHCTEIIVICWEENDTFIVIHVLEQLLLLLPLFNWKQCVFSAIAKRNSNLFSPK